MEVPSPPAAPTDSAAGPRLLRWAMIAASLLVFSLVFSPAGPPLQAGTDAPGLNLANLDGSPVDLSSHQGKPTFINFFATWCRPCLAEIPELNRVQEAVGQDVNVVGLLVFSGSAEEAGPAVRSLGIRYPVWMTDDESAARWKVSAVPASFLVDTQGKVRWSVNGGIDADTVFEALREMGAPALPK